MMFRAGSASLTGLKSSPETTSTGIDRLSETTAIVAERPARRHPPTQVA